MREGKGLGGMVGMLGGREPAQVLVGLTVSGGGWLMLAWSRPQDGYIMEYQSSSPVGGNFGIGYFSQSIARV